ncbi:hypothetical protein D3C76_1297590 [compost metagenome]
MDNLGHGEVGYGLSNEGLDLIFGESKHLHNRLDERPTFNVAVPEPSLPAEHADHRAFNCRDCVVGHSKPFREVQRGSEENVLEMDVEQIRVFFQNLTEVRGIA